MNTLHSSNAEQALGEIYKKLLNVRQSAINLDTASVIGLEYFQGALDVAVAAIEVAMTAPGAPSIPANVAEDAGGKV